MKGQPAFFFEFDAFRVDVGERRVSRNGQAVTLTPKVFDILLVLLEKCGQPVEKETLIRVIWKDTFVEEGNLNRNVCTLRKLLGDSSHEQKFIKTIPKRGYQFTANVRKIVETDDRLQIERVSRSRLTVREETYEIFWTRTKIAVLAASLMLLLTLGSVRFLNVGLNVNGGVIDTEAAEDFRKGRELWKNRSAAGLHDATLLLERATRKQPDFALAHAALADAYAFDYANWKKAEDSAQKSIEIEPSLGEPHASIGFIKMFWQWELADSENEFKQAVDLSPKYATGHQWYAANLAATGHTDAAIAEIQKASVLDPTSAAINSDYCQLLYFAKRNNEALEICQKALQMDIGLLSAHEHIFDIYASMSLYDAAVDKFIEFERLANGKLSPNAESKLRNAYRDGGITGFYKAQIDYYSSDNPNKYRQARAYARLGENGPALDTLTDSYNKTEFDSVFFIADPVFADMQYDPQMLALQRKFLKLDKQ